MKTWKSNLEETKQRYINWWNHKGIILNMWEHFQEGVQPHAEITPPAPAKDLSQKVVRPSMESGISGLVCGAQQSEGRYSSGCEYPTGSRFSSRHFRRSV